jgi:hypothetical protein
MSLSYEVDYDLIRRRRQEANESRVREATRPFLERYQDTLDQIRNEGLDEFVREEFDRIEHLLQEAWDLLDDEPFEARNASREVGNLIRGLGRRARDARNGDRMRQREEYHAQRAAERAARQEEIERLREERAQEMEADRERRAEEIEAARAARVARAAFVARMSETIKSALRDPVAYDLARDRAEALADRCADRINAGGVDVAVVEGEFVAELGKLAETAKAEADRWREGERAGHATEDAASKVEESLEAIRRNVTAESSEKLKGVLDGLLRIKEGLEKGEVKAEEAAEASDKAVDDCVEELVNEDVRRETLVALIGTVQSLGFVLLGEPEFTEDGGVLVLARRPSGEECQFVVRADGGMRYAFENYAGTACRKDCAQVEAMLREAYGVVLSNERVIWENPDEVGKDTFRDGIGETTKGGL